MRRSVREATIGFSLLAALLGGLGLWFWLSGVVFGKKTWAFQLSFKDAAGLAPQSVVTYQGVPVGSVEAVTPQAGVVLVRALITNPALKLYRPITAQIRSGSLLGGNPQVALETVGAIAVAGTSAGPTDPGCNSTRLICQDDQITGQPTPSLSTVMGLMESLLTQAEQDKLISKGSTTLTALTKTSEDFSSMASKAEELIAELKRTVEEAAPMVSNLNSATAHASSVIGSLDNPKTLHELKQTVSNAEQLTRKLDAIGADVEQLSGDPDFINGLRSVTVGLGKFFDELYPEMQHEVSKD